MLTTLREGPFFIAPDATKAIVAARKLLPTRYEGTSPNQSQPNTLYYTKREREGNRSLLLLADGHALQGIKHTLH